MPSAAPRAKGRRALAVMLKKNDSDHISQINIQGWVWKLPRPIWILRNRRSFDPRPYWHALKHTSHDHRGALSMHEA